MAGQHDLDQGLLDDLARRFGSAIDEANGEALAVLATEISQLEPALWQRKPAHDLLDVVGVPRAGVFSPYSLNERLLVFLRRRTAADAGPTGEVSDDPAAEGEGEAAEGEGVDVEDEPGAAPLVDAVEALDQAAREEAELTHVVSDEPTTADVEIVGLAATLEGMRTELAVLRQLVEALGERLGRIEDALNPQPPEAQETEPPAAEGTEEAESETEAEAGSEADAEDDVGAASEAEAEAPPDTPVRRSLRRVLLVLLLVMVGVALAGMVVLIVVYTWDQVRSQAQGVLHPLGGLIS